MLEEKERTLSGELHGYQWALPGRHRRTAQ